MIQNQELESTEMKSASALNHFEQTVNTMEPQGKPVEFNQPRLPQAVPTPPPPPRANPTMDGLGDKLEAIIEQQTTPSNGNSKDSQAQLMVYLAKDLTTLFHSPEGDSFVSIMVDEHIETVRVRSQEFCQWLGRIYYKKVGKPPGAQAIKDAMAHLEAEGRFDGPEISSHLRYAQHEESFYIDLCDRSWSQVQISKDGWEVIGSKHSPVKFFRAQGMAALPFPSNEGTIDLLKHYLNIQAESDWVMIASWLIGSMRPTGPFSILVLQGEQGTAKSTTARLLRDLIDPSTVPSQSLPKSERDLVIAASKSWVLNFDNLSTISPAMSDALCRLATGGGFRTRALYTDDTERLFNSIRPMIMNGITDIATRHDLADRSLIVQLQPIKKSSRIPEKELMKAWETQKGKLFGALCSAVSMALANVDSVKLENLPRMADFATWVTAAEPALGWASGTFMQEYENNQKSLVLTALEADPVAIAVIRLIKRSQKHEWHGTASDLQVICGVNQDLISLRSWPNSANILAGRVRRAAASLREIGIEVEFTKSGDRIIHIMPNQSFKLDDGLVCESNHVLDDEVNQDKSVSARFEYVEDSEVGSIPDLPDARYPGYLNDDL